MLRRLRPHGYDFNDRLARLRLPADEPLFAVRPEWVPCKFSSSRRPGAAPGVAALALNEHDFLATHSNQITPELIALRVNHAVRRPDGEHPLKEGDNVASTLQPFRCFQFPRLALGAAAA